MAVKEFTEIRDKTTMTPKCLRTLVVLGVTGLGLVWEGAYSVAADSWTHWRGEAQQGIAPPGKYPVQWEEGQQDRWRIELTGRGGSTPVISGGLAFVTMGQDGQNHLSAIDVQTGEVRWNVALGEDKGGKHKKGSGSNPSPTTDGKHVFAYFRSGDLACVDVTGKVVWQRNLQQEYGEDTLWWDLGSSPVLTDQGVVIAVMQSPPSPSYVAMFSKTSGEVVWKVDRELDAPSEAAQSYTSPLVCRVNGQELIAILGADHLTLQDAETGKELARLGGFNPAAEQYFRSIASPVIDGEIIVCPYARGSSLTAVNMSKLLTGAGKDAIVWHHDKMGSDVPTPAARDGRLYLCSDKGEVRVLDMLTGETLWEQTLPPNRHGFSSSPLVTESHIYLTREDGRVFVVALPKNDQPASIVAQNGLGDDEQYTVASPVPVSNGLLFRTANTLVHVAAQ